MEQSLVDKMGRGGAKWIHDTYSASREYVTTLFMIDHIFSAIISRSELYVKIKEEERPFVDNSFLQALPLIPTYTIGSLIYAIPVLPCRFCINHTLHPSFIPNAERRTCPNHPSHLMVQT